MRNRHIIDPNQKPDRRTPMPPRRSPAYRMLLAAVGLAAVIAVGAAIFFAYSDTDVVTLDGQPNAVGYSIDDLHDDPYLFEGQRVSAVGEVDERYSAQVFTLEDEVGGDEILVLTQGAQAMLLTEDDLVQVTGTVIAIDDDVRESLDELGVDEGLYHPELFEISDAEAALVASAVTLIDHDVY